MSSERANPEESLLRHSLWLTLALAAIGVGFGLISGSPGSSSTGSARRSTRR